MQETPFDTKQRIEQQAKDSMLSTPDLMQSFDAQVWAREFVKCNIAYHIGLDEGALTAWFASALMRGWDEYRWRSKEYKRQVRRAIHPWWSWKRYFTPLSKFGH